MNILNKTLLSVTGMLKWLNKTWINLIYVDL